MKIKEIIAKLCASASPSGFEDGVSQTVVELLRPYADEIKTDVMGNFTAFLKTDGDAATLMLSAHMDEIGLIITGHEDRGFLRFAAIGGVDTRMLPAQQITIMTEPPLEGIISVMPPHVLSHEEMEKVMPLEGLFIDTGLSKEEAQRLIPPGTPAVISAELGELGSGFLHGRGLDNKACAAILIKVFEELSKVRPKVNIALLLTAQEEVGRRGAKTGVYSLDSDCAIVLDATFGETPDSKPEKTFKLGGGAAVGVGPSLNRKMTNKLFEIAQRLELPHETEVLAGDSGTDGWVIELSRDGVPTALVSLPLRYMHTPVEVMSIADADVVAKLITEYARCAAEVEL